MEVIAQKEVKDKLYPYTIFRERWPVLRSFKMDKVIYINLKIRRCCMTLLILFELAICVS